MFNPVQFYEFGKRRGLPIDADAQAFITASQITNQTQILAINTLVVNLKSNSLWSKMKYIYPMVGGTAFSHKWNLKDSRDLDAAFRLNFIGGWTHTATGALPNGTNGYANTFLYPQVNLGLNNTHIAFYHRIQTAISKQAVHGVEGDASGERFFLFPQSFNIGTLSDMYNNTNGRLTINLGTSKGLIFSSRISAISHKIYLNGSLKASNTTSGGVLPNRPFFMSAGNTATGAQFFSNNEVAFASIGDGLTDAEALTYYNIIQAYQTTLSRQI